MAPAIKLVPLIVGVTNSTLYGVVCSDMFLEMGMQGEVYEA